MYDELDHSYPTAPSLSSGEAILWKGKPQKKGFICTKSLTMLPIAVLWLFIDLNIISSAFSEGEMLGFLIPFFALHLMPVWIWLGNVLTAGKRWKNTMYYATNRRIIIQSGFWAVNETSVFYKDIRNVDLRIGFLDKLFHTGDLWLDDGCYTGKQQTPAHTLEDLDEPQQVYRRLQKIILDMQTDMEFPNAYRPEDNPGYNTQYRP